MANPQPDKIIYTMMRVSKFYGTKQVLKNISISYFYGAKIGVIGLNGSGKSSLLRIFAGVDTEYNGQAVLSPGYTVGMLEQEPHLDETKTVRDIVEEGVKEITGLVDEFNRINEKFAEPMSDDEMAALIERQGKVYVTPATMRWGRLNAEVVAPSSSWLPDNDRPNRQFEMARLDVKLCTSFDRE